MKTTLAAFTFWMLALDALGAEGNYVAFTNHLLKGCDFHAARARCDISLRHRI